MARTLASCLPGSVYIVPGRTSVIPKKVKLSLELSRELDQMLQEIAEESATTKSEVLRRALALAEIAHDARREKRFLGLVDDRRKLDTEIVGLP